MTRECSTFGWVREISPPLSQLNKDAHCYLHNGAWDVRDVRQEPGNHHRVSSIYSVCDTDYNGLELGTIDPHHRHIDYLCYAKSEIMHRFNLLPFNIMKS
jgi:hypothetical protein